MRKHIVIPLFVILVLTGGSLNLSADTLTTIDREVYEGKMVAFKYGVIYFNIYKFGRYHSKKTFPLAKIWKIEFNTPKQDILQSQFETESKYKKLRRRKRLKKVTLHGDKQWIDTGIRLKPGRDILFDIVGSITINKETTVLQNGELELQWHRNKQMPTQPTGAVIARVGEEGKAFYVGDNKAPIRITAEGNLFIGINDFLFTDNTGKFQVSIYY